MPLAVTRADYCARGHGSGWLDRLVTRNGGAAGRTEARMSMPKSA